MKSNILEYHASPDLLQDRIILITGAGDGLGATAAQTFAAHGATVILLGKTIKKLEKIYDQITAAGYKQPAIVPLDLEGATEEHYQQLCDTIEQEFGRLDGLLHNAAFLGALMPIDHYEAKLWARVLQTNLTAPFLMTRALLPVLRKSTDASLVFTSASEVRQGRAYWGAYSVSKAGADNLMHILASELETNTSIRVNSLVPGPVRTQLRRLAFPGEDPGRLPEPESLMPGYLYLFGPNSKDIKGQIIHLQEPLA